MDGDYIETIESGETLVLRKVSLGYHTFEAEDVYDAYYGSVPREISSGVNYVTIPVYAY